MKKLVSILLSLMLVAVSGLAAAQANPYEVTEPITIEYWHAMESQYDGLMQEMVAAFHEQYPLITVEPIYIGSYTVLNEKFIAANAAGEVPAISMSNTNYVAPYGDSGVCEPLTDYIAASGYDIEDIGVGLQASTQYDGVQISLPCNISTQVMYYNKTAAEAEGIEMPKTWDEMDAFVKKATVKNADGTTARYALAIGAWDYWYFETLFMNNGVKVINDDGETTDINGEVAAAMTAQIQQWCKDGYAYVAYGSEASPNMRQSFMDGKVFAVTHTSSLYEKTYKAKSPFEVGIAWYPTGTAGTKISEVGGSVLFIPSKASQEQKNAAWLFLQFVTSKENNIYWAENSGYLPTRQSALTGPDAEKYLETKPAIQVVFENLNEINPRNQNPIYATIATMWAEGFAKICVDGADVQSTLDEYAELINETLQDQ